MRAIWITLLGVALLAGSAAGASQGGSVDLVAYSTPKDAYGTDHLGLPEDAGRQRHELQPVLRRVRRPGTRRRGRPERRPRRALARSRHRPARRQGPGPEELGRQLAPRDRLRLGRRVRRAGRQSEAHQGLGRPGQAGHPGDHAEPVHFGRRALERDGRLRRAAAGRQDRQAGDRVPVQALPARPGAARQRPRGAARSSRRARATSCSRTRTRRSTPSRRACTPSTRRRRRRC